MPFTAGMMDISGNIGNNIAAGGQALGKAIEQVGDTYAESKAADFAAHTLASQGAMSKDDLSNFMGLSVGAKQKMLGTLSSKWILGQQMQNQLALQNNQAQNTVKVAAATAPIEAQTAGAKTAAEVAAYKNAGLIPPGQLSPDQRPAPNLTTAAPTAPGQPAPSNQTQLSPENLKAQGFVQTKDGRWGNPATGMMFDPSQKDPSKAWSHMTNQ